MADTHMLIHPDALILDGNGPVHQMHSEISQTARMTWTAGERGHARLVARRLHDASEEHRLEDELEVPRLTVALQHWRGIAGERPQTR